MKKLMIAACAVAFAAAAQAASINWNTGALYNATDIANGDGTIGHMDTSLATPKWVYNDKITSSTGYTFAYYLIESTSAISFDAGEFYQWHADGAEGKFKGLTVTTGTATPGSSATTGSANSGVDFYVEGEKTTVNGAILLVAIDAEGKDVMYMENFASKDAAKSTPNVANLANYIGADKNNGYMSWTAAPEPTSGLLLLIGVGALALKRKRA